MSWLRTRRRTLDIVTEQPLLGTSSTTKNNTMDEGNYTLQLKATSHNNGTVAVSNNNSDDSTFMNGVLSISPCGRKEELLEEDTQDPSGLEFMSIYKNDDKDKKECNVNITEHGEHSSYNKNTSSDPEVGGDSPPPLILKQLVDTTVEDSDSIVSLSPPLQHAVDDDITLNFTSFVPVEETNVNNELNETEERDVFPENKLSYAKNKKNFNKPRHSLDSQMALLPKTFKSNLKDRSLESLKEQEGDEENILPRQQKKKSISWASDLETVHEFEKIKGRRLSLSALFKKF